MAGWHLHTVLATQSYNFWMFTSGAELLELHGWVPVAN